MSVTEIQSDLLELKQLLNQATRPRVQNALNFEIRKVEAELQKFADSQAESDQKAPAKTAVSKPPTKNYEVKLQNYAWDQSDNLVKIFVSLNGVEALPEENISVTNDERSMELRVIGLENKDYMLKIVNLLKPIGECTCRTKKDMVVVSMKKINPGQKWSHITETEKRAADAKAPKKPEAADADMTDPSGGLMNLMKQMYQDGDDEMKRMIAKAWTEGRDKQTPDFNIVVEAQKFSKFRAARAQKFCIFCLAERRSSLSSTISFFQEKQKTDLLKM
ncbi:calcyclin-binding protein [Neocloeon triangulifer]|uniref:calcyclin-binding protein n=1 Tax=Neocloeon triangulifer TaxID=2078957 RepID=UPI00286ED973|nr:calcyclin-binding protein [Neocloeon triangulifer]